MAAGKRRHTAEGPVMVDFLVLVMIHGILALAAWRLVLRPDLDSDPDSAAGQQTEPPQGA